LRKAFGIMVIGIAGYVLTQALTEQLLNSAQLWLADAKGPGMAVVGLLLALLVILIGRWIHKAETIVFTPH
jgi:hypothetical protein